MKEIVNYFRELFCRHDYIIDEKPCKETNKYGVATGIKVSMICKKCGYHKSFWKYQPN